MIALGAWLFAQQNHAPRLDASSMWLILAALVVLVFLFAIIIAMLAFGKLWFQAYMSNAQVTMFSLIGMSLRQVNRAEIVQAKIMAMQAGIGTDPETGITTRRLEAHYLAGGRVLNVISAIIAAHRADIDLDFDRAAAIDLAGRDVLEAVRTSVNPKVIDCPDATQSKKTTLSAIAKNGVELKIRARVTVRTNLSQLIGGATEETIVARVGEGIITSIGSSASHLIVMENPDRISKAVLDRGLDAHTAFEIVSIDIADIDVGANIGARLQADQAEADTRVARARAEERRSFAIAREQEMKARTTENRARVVLAEAQVPLAMAAAFAPAAFTIPARRRMAPPARNPDRRPSKRPLAGTWAHYVGRLGRCHCRSIRSDRNPPLAMCLNRREFVRLPLLGALAVGTRGRGARAELPAPVVVARRPSAPYRVWFQPRLFDRDIDLYANMTVDASGWLDPRLAELAGKTGLNWVYGLNHPSADGPGYWRDACAREARTLPPVRSASRFVGAGIAIDEWVAPKRDANERWLTDGLRMGRRTNPDIFISVWVTDPTPALVELAREGTVDLLIVEGYTHSAAGSPPELTIRWQDALRRCDVLAGAGLESKTIFCFGHITAQANRQGKHLSPQWLQERAAELKRRYPRMPGIAFFQSVSEDSPELRELVRACDRMSVKLWPDPPE